MIKEGIKRTAIMLAVYLLCVGSVLSVLIYNFKTFETDYTKEVQGQWTALQYFQNKAIHPYDTQNGFIVTVEGNRISCQFFDGRETIRGTFDWKNGYSGTVTMEDGFTSFVSVDMNTRGDLKLRITEANMVLLLGDVEDGV